MGTAGKIRSPDEAPGARATALDKHSLLISGHRTSISLERAFWERLGQIADMRRCSIASVVAEIDAARGEANLSSAIRVYLLETFASTSTR